MNKEQKEKIINEIASQVEGSEAILAVDYRGINVPQINELRTKLREADATFRVVKNTLTERAVDKLGASELGSLLDGPTAFTFVRGDIALAAKALNKFVTEEGVIEFKGGYMDGSPLTAEELVDLAMLPPTPQLQAQLVGTLFSPITVLTRGLNSLIQGLATSLVDLREKRAAESPDEVEKAESDGVSSKDAEAEDAERESSGGAETDESSDGGGDRPQEEEKDDDQELDTKNNKED